MTWLTTSTGIEESEEKKMVTPPKGVQYCDNGKNFIAGVDTSGKFSIISIEVKPEIWYGEHK